MQTFAHFDQLGNFVRIFTADSLPAIPLADDGLPRTVEMQKAPEITSSQRLVAQRNGAWAVEDIDPSGLPVPGSVSPAQLREALIDFGILPEQITTALSKISDAKAKAKALARWEYATAIERAHPLIAQMAGAFGLTTGQVDAIFRAASEL